MPRRRYAIARGGSARPWRSSPTRRCGPVGVLKMADEAGGDAKVLAVPVDKVLPWYKHWQKPEDIQPERLAQIQHFFEHYKDLEPGKWVKVLRWGNAADAHQLITEGIARAKAK